MKKNFFNRVLKKKKLQTRLNTEDKTKTFSFQNSINIFIFILKKNFLLLLFFFSIIILIFFTAAYLEIKRFINLPEYTPSALVIDENEFPLFISSPNSDRIGYWKMKNTPERIKYCILTTEDKRFYSHCGVDLFAVLRAAYKNIKYGRRTGGASTIAMQAARLITNYERNYKNKLYEMLLSIALVRKYGKDRVLDFYLTAAPFGPRIYGLRCAAKLYFNKPPEDLSWAEAALISGIPQSPSKFNLFDNRGFRLSLDRGMKILKKIRANKIISERDFKIAIKELSDFIRPDMFRRNPIMYHSIIEIDNLLKKKLSADFNSDYLYKNNYLIKSTLNFNLQKKIDFIIKNEIEKYRPAGADNCGAIIVENNTGGIKSYIGSADYNDFLFSGAINYCRILRSPGSTLKPFIFAEGMQTAGFTAASILEDVGLILTLKNGIYSPKNYKRNFFGPIIYRAALGNSRNIPAVRIAHKIGIVKISEMLLKIGLADNQEIISEGGMSIALGGMPATLEQLASAYCSLANDGKKMNLSFFSQVDDLDKNGSIQIFDKNIARQITLFLSDPLSRLPVFERLGNLEYNFPVAIKTGTSTGYRDTLTAAYTKKYTVCVWIGTRNNTKMNRLTGENSAAAIAAKILNTLHPQDKTEYAELEFPFPEKQRQYSICKLSGCEAGENCRHITLEWLDEKFRPKKKCNIHKNIYIDKRTGKTAKGDCPEECKELRRITLLPDKFADWAVESGFELPPPDFKSGSDYVNENSNNNKLVRKIIINEPADQSKIFFETDTPEEFQTLALKTIVEPAVEKILWVIDDKPYKIQSYPYTSRWCLRPGKHIVWVKMLDTGQESDKVFFVVE